MRSNPSDRMAFMDANEVAGVRGSAREAARLLFLEGIPSPELTLDMVAARADLPASALSVAYGSVEDLLNDLLDEWGVQVMAAQSDIGDRGFVAELTRIMDAFLDTLADDPSNIEILRWQILLIARGELIIPGGVSTRGWLDTIRNRSGEVYAMSVEDLSTILQAGITGMHLQFLLRGADDVALRAWRREAKLATYAWGRLAMPTPDERPPVPRGD